MLGKTRICICICCNWNSHDLSTFSSAAEELDDWIALAPKGGPPSFPQVRRLLMGALDDRQQLDWLRVYQPPKVIAGTLDRGCRRVVSGESLSELLEHLRMWSASANIFRLTESSITALYSNSHCGKSSLCHKLCTKYLKILKASQPIKLLRFNQKAIQHLSVAKNQSLFCTTLHTIFNSFWKCCKFWPSTSNIYFSYGIITGDNAKFETRRERSCSPLHLRETFLSCVWQ